MNGRTVDDPVVGQNTKGAGRKRLRSTTVMLSRSANLMKHRSDCWDDAEHIDKFVTVTPTLRLDQGDIPP